MNDEDQRRAETGTMRFGDDWPGVFIRGDNAVFYGMQLTSLLDMIESAAKRSMDAGSPSPVDLLSLSFAAMMLRGLARSRRYDGRPLRRCMLAGYVALPAALLTSAP